VGLHRAGRAGAGILSHLVRARHDRHVARDDRRQDPQGRARRRRDRLESGAARGFGTWAAFTLSVALYKPLGFTISFALLTAFTVAVIFRRSLVAAAATGIGLAVAFHLVFAVALDVALPTGWLGF